ncbi:MAG: alpha/beta hydrolase [Candidatus Nitrosocosmicus sp.]
MNRLTSVTTVFCFAFILLFYSGFINSHQQNTVFGQEKNNIKSTATIPTTISKESQNALINITSQMPDFVFPKPNDLIGWEELNKRISSMSIAQSKALVDSFGANITSTKIGNVKVLDIKPKNWINNDKIIIYVHGGGYTILGANSTLTNSVTMANVTGLRIISVDYTLAPFSKWNDTTTEVVSVIKSLKDQGYSLKNMAMYGDSAGGGLVASSVLKMRDEGIGMPAVLVLWSPWTDVSRSGDTYSTLKSADVFIPESMLKNMGEAYANVTDQKNPYVSPVYGDFSKGFPPTLIQVGTKEILLSDSVRLYQALDQADIPVKLDIYEGMPHVFQTTLYKTPESTMAISKTNDFIREYLNY